MRRSTTWRAIPALTALLVGALLAGCSEPLPEDDAATGPGTEATDGAAADACAGDDLLACAEGTTLAPFLPDAPTEATGAPIVLGMINQENTPAGSYPELSQAVQAGVAFINEQLGGVAGRPLEVEVCNTEFSTEGSTACAQGFVEDEVPAVLGGIDVFGNGIEVLDDNEIPYIGGIPVSTQSVTSPNSFQWSGGSWGAAVAFAHYASAELGAERVSIVYGEFGSITDSAESAQQVLENRGVEVTMVPFPILAADISSPLNVAAASDPDAVFVLAADSGCKAGFDGLAALGLDATSFYVGACATPAIVEEAGPEKTEGAIFNVEGEVGEELPNDDFLLYSSVVETYGADGLDPVGAGTVSYRALMNLWMVMQQVEGDITPDALTEVLRAQTDAPSYAGHDYTCDGEQFEGLPAMCSPQQILAEMRDGALVQLGEWIDVGAVYAES